MGLEKNKLTGCLTKKQYKTDDEANLAGLHRMKMFKEKQLYYYYCNNCKQFHLTKNKTKHRIV